ncbi:hypothetical protein MRB53_015299 [Persea americana]|uniref:Uncharacterized protein n=1 Tax=Persea americana TaxID=3435 RepID=A0ACC2KDH3_PERAE|nr:hypothetical protein MRB53_015299 [Persea americana]
MQKVFHAAGSERLRMRTGEKKRSEQRICLQGSAFEETEDSFVSEFVPRGRRSSFLGFTVPREGERRRALIAAQFLVPKDPDCFVSQSPSPETKKIWGSRSRWLLIFVGVLIIAGIQTLTQKRGDRCNFLAGKKDCSGRTAASPELRAPLCSRCHLSSDLNKEGRQSEQRRRFCLSILIA